MALGARTEAATTIRDAFGSAVARGDRSSGRAARSRNVARRAGAAPVPQAGAHKWAAVAGLVVIASSLVPSTLPGGTFPSYADDQSLLAGVVFAYMLFTVAWLIAAHLPRPKMTADAPRDIDAVRPNFAVVRRRC